MSILQIFRNIKLLVCDFDGVFTNNCVIVDENGKESVVCSRADGFGVELLKKKGRKIIVISKEKSNIVKARCNKMGISSFCEINDKLKILKREMARYNLKPNEVCYMGNDINDIECIKYVVGVAVDDAVEEAKKNAEFITKNKGGRGAVREITDLILANTRP